MSTPANEAGGPGSSRQTAVIAIDGPSGSGKSTIARRVAVALELRYLDTGAMYRAATWWVLDQGVDATDSDAVVAAVRGLVLVSGTDPEAPSITVRSSSADVDVDLTEAVRSAAVTGAVSAVSAIAQVREILVSAQRAIIGDGGIVVEGRDIGTTVWPAAPVKVFLTASEQARAARRSAEVAGAIETVREDLARRDRMDTRRAASPLAVAADAVTLDSTGLGIADVVIRVLGLVRERTGIEAVRSRHGSGSGDDSASRGDAEPAHRDITLDAAGAGHYRNVIALGELVSG
jgi:cytidylate kinase